MIFISILVPHEEGRKCTSVPIFCPTPSRRSKHRCVSLHLNNAHKHTQLNTHTPTAKRVDPSPCPPMPLCKGVGTSSRLPSLMPASLALGRVAASTCSSSSFSNRLGTSPEFSMLLMSSRNSSSTICGTQVRGHGHQHTRTSVNRT